VGNERNNLLAATERGLYCPGGEFFIDPRRAVERALITHAHSDHARRGAKAYLCAAPSVELLRERLGHSAIIEGWPYGERRAIGGVTVSFHPAGHILGSAQIRVEQGGEVWVVSGDFKLQADPTCAPFEPVRCHVFITESTFALPMFQWPPPTEVFRELHAWWRENQGRGRASVLLAYSLGKAQRLLAGLDVSFGPVFAHPAIQNYLTAYAAAGISLPPVAVAKADLMPADALVLMPPSRARAEWHRALRHASTAMASGWMALRSRAGQGRIDRGLILSDHADWAGLVEAVKSSGASRILVDHGYIAPFCRWLRKNGWDAAPLFPQKEPMQGELFGDDAF
jgi:putative mRNA 3-end processing factor